MTAFLLLRAIRRFLEQQTSRFAFDPGTEDDSQAPKVFDWDLPFPDPANPEGISYPYICVRPARGADREDAAPADAPAALSSTVDIEFVFGICRRGTDAGCESLTEGYELLNLMEHVRTSLFRQYILDGKFAIEKPYEWEISWEQPPDYWIGKAKSTWAVQSIMPILEEVHLFD
ncbi:hypothetical protein DUZ99_04635 [Xylanibacillus composti]|uniref:Uncharacterized protein n=1 Tax=Xylanibacillus composti TaxID=1572762 RepID=A0A8J4M1W9_9BACL|nr:hypothetical protein [Xylanibacillus composti]MDT9724275.1 hypothetical protein [Xylanibacillus composti]GIQ69270.1 hypothetical protein XYCOK13_20940 [Xylanibacillus composti]